MTLYNRSEDFDGSDDDHDLPTDQYVKNQRAKLEARLGLSNVPGMDSKALGVTDDDVMSPPKKRLKKEKSNGNQAPIDLNEQWKLMFDEAPNYEPSSSDWPLKWFYSRIRLGLGSTVSLPFLEFLTVLGGVHIMCRKTTVTE